MGYNMKVVIQWGKLTFGGGINIWQGQGVYFEIFPNEEEGGRGGEGKRGEKNFGWWRGDFPPSRESPDKVANQFPNPADFATKNIFPADFKQKQYCFSSNSLHIAITVQQASKGNNHSKSKIQHLQRNMIISL